MEQIVKGDLVMVVRQPCCGRDLGKVFTAGCVRPSRTGYLVCSECGVRGVAPIVVENGAPTGPAPLELAPVSWLKRIDPPALTETTDTREELPA